MFVAGRERADDEAISQRVIVIAMCGADFYSRARVERAILDSFCLHGSEDKSVWSRIL